MADYFCSCSVLLPYDTDEERTWLERELGVATGERCERCKQLETACICPDGFHFTEDFGGFFMEPGHTDGDERPAFWICGEESASGEVLADVVSRFQREFDKEDYWICDFAYTCSKPRVDSFGGYSILVHRGEPYWFIPNNEVDDKVQALWKQEQFEQTLPMY